MFFDRYSVAAKCAWQRKICMPPSQHSVLKGTLGGCRSNGYEKHRVKPQRVVQKGYEITMWAAVKQPMVSDGGKRHYSRSGTSHPASAGGV